MSKNLSIIIRCSGMKPVRLSPGQKLRIGRHSSNEYVLNDGTVSRFHAGIVWDRDEDRPYVVDNKSANGVEVDGHLIDERHHLMGGNSVQIGRFTLAVELRQGGEGEKSAEEEFLVADDADGGKVKLFSDKGKELQGDLLGRSAVQRLALDLEESKRTGTLTLTPKDGAIGKFMVVLSQGKVVTAEGQDMTGKGALRVLLGLPESSYRFTREVTPSETEFLNLSVRAFLETEMSIDTTKLQSQVD
jgi:pSer/pThr/pTyr-binding forkhead associated (FHA) protein